MRLVKVSAPQGMGTSVAQTAFSAGIEKVSLYQTQSVSSDGKVELKDTIDIETSTPKGKKFVDALLESDFYNSENFSIAVRQPRAIVSSDSIRELTKPLEEPGLDIFEELWQFSHVTYGFVGRFLIGACLLAYGIIEQKTLLIVAGLLFLPLVPPLLAIGFGSWTKNFKLAGQGFFAFLVATTLLFLGGVIIALISEPPIKYDEFSPLLVSFLISLAVGIAAGLANIDDVGRRELIGLAATAQIAIIPVWFGVCTIFGFPPTASQNVITTRATTFFVNTLTIIAASLAVYVLSGVANRAVSRMRDK